MIDIARAFHSNPWVWCRPSSEAVHQEPDMQGIGVKLGYWVQRSPFPGTRRWEWVITGVDCALNPGMTHGYNHTRWGARRSVRGAQRFWKARGFDIAAPGGGRS